MPVQWAPRVCRYITLNPRAARKCGAAGTAALAAAASDADDIGRQSARCGGRPDTLKEVGGSIGSGYGRCDVEAGSGGGKPCCKSGSCEAAAPGAGGGQGGACCGTSSCSQQERWSAPAKAGAVAGPAGRSGGGGGGGGCCGCSGQAPELVPEALQRCWDQRLAFAAATYRVSGTLARESFGGCVWGSLAFGASRTRVAMAGAESPHGTQRAPVRACVGTSVPDQHTCISWCAAQHAVPCARVCARS